MQRMERHSALQIKAALARGTAWQTPTEQMRSAHAAAAGLQAL